jgi:hypothetical protein
MYTLVERTELARLVDAARDPSITPAEWARRAGYTPQLIADFRNHGKNVTVDVLLKMLDAIGARLQVLPAGAEAAAPVPTPPPPTRPALADAEGARVVDDLTRTLIAAQTDPQVRAFVIGAVRGAIAGARATLQDDAASGA